MMLTLGLKRFLLVEILLVLVLILAGKLSKSLGKKNVLSLLAYVLGVAVSFSLLHIGLCSFWDDPSVSECNDKSLRFSIVVPPIMWLIFIGYRLVVSLSYPKVELEEEEQLPRVEIEEQKLPAEDIINKTQSMYHIRVAHLSDLHLTSGRTIEGNIEKDKVCNAVLHAVRWALTKADLVFLTGDLTDQGQPEEWALFLKIVAHFSEDEREKLLLVPGNHDLTLNLGWSEGKGVDLDYERRCKSFTLNILKGLEQRWSMIDFPKSIPVKEHLDKVQPFLHIYEKYPAEIRVTSDGIPWVHRPIEFNKEMRTYYPWPTLEKNQFSDFIQMAYPMMLYEDEKYIVIALNSCNAYADTLLSSGFGALGEDQINRLLYFLNHYASKLPIILLHHHIGFPETIMRRLPGLSIKTLQLNDAVQFDQALSTLPASVVFHGHMHMGYHARRGGNTIISGPSVTYGDSLSKGSNCFVYGIDELGNVSVLEEATILPS